MKMKIGLKLNLLVAAIFIIIFGLIIYTVSSLRVTAFSARFNTAKVAADIGYEIIQFHYNRYINGDCTEQEAKYSALEQLKFIRYEGVEYFWVNTSDLPYPTMVMHSANGSLDGLVLDNPKYNVAMGRDQNLFQAFAEVCRDNGEGFVNYLWPHPGETIPVEKISYVKLFTEWNWIIGTGVYIDIVNNTINTLIIRTILMLLLFIVVTYIFVSLMGYKIIVSPINIIKDALKNISKGEGDLNQRIKVKSKDEIGDMANYFNLTFDKIRYLVTLVKHQSTLLQDVGINLTSNMTETAAAVNEITANIQSIKNQIMNQSASVTETSATMEQISKGIDRLNKLIDNQSANVTESSSAIEEMMANIGSVTQTLVKNTENIKKLSSSSEAGRSVLDKISVAIRDVSKESEGLMEISKIIQDIASQTNLLSMNAAIEAAHAGESGKGFAVVADEIRKLAESSSSQTKTISSVLKKITESMAEINKHSEDVLTKFTTIETEVAIVAEQEEGIRNAMEEQSEGSKQVLEAIKVLNDITQKVQASSIEMLTGSNQVSKEAKNMNAITQEITSGMNEMASGANQISVAVNTVNELSAENKNSIDALIIEVNKFKV